MKLTTIALATICALSGTAALARTPEFGSPVARSADSYERPSAGTQMNKTPICEAPPIIDRYAQSTATPPGCPGASGPYN
jgi:hypothetical protein